MNVPLIIIQYLPSLPFLPPSPSFHPSFSQEMDKDVHRALDRLAEASPYLLLLLPSPLLHLLFFSDINLFDFIIIEILKYFC